jgi:alpha,alpha-trehalase
VIPAALGSLAFPVRYRGHLVHLRCTPTSASIRVDPDEGAAMTVEVAGEVHVLEPGQAVDVVLDGGHLRPTP